MILARQAAKTASASIRRQLAAAAAAAAIIGVPATLAASAQAGFGPIELQSVGALEQFEAADEPAVSGDGRYLAFQGTLGGVRGIWRRDLNDGALALVAGSSIYGAGGATDAFAPSISADGRYVSFTTAAALVKAAHQGTNVFVRDLDVSAPPAGVCAAEEEKLENGKRCAYELASALSGSSEGLSYSAGGGALASAHVALSASGREVAFVIESASDLNSANPEAPTTPGLQVAVRYLDSDTTTLVSQTMASLGSAPEPVPGGAITPVVQSGAAGRRLMPGAALSADGSTVAWLGAHIPAQAPTLDGERQLIEADDTVAGEHYDEPLWRRIADGPGAPIRRMVGGGDPLAPGCPPEGTLEIQACRGPFPGLAAEPRGGGEETNLGWLAIDQYDGLPQLSGDGWTAALIGDPTQYATSNVFVVDMREGLDRDQALRQLTRETPVPNVDNPGTRPQYVSIAGDVLDIGMSPDGEKVAFTTQREQFPLAPPNFTEAPLAELGLAEMYQIDLAGESLVRVTHGPGDGPSLDGARGVVTSSGAAGPAYSGDGRTLAFADPASNFVSGDANGASDVFSVADMKAPDVPGPVEIGQAPPSREPIVPRWALSVVPVVRSDGSATLDVVVPSAGTLSATASAVVPLAGAGALHGARDRAGRRQRRPKHVARLKSKTVAFARAAAKDAGLVELRLRIGSRYASLLSTPAGFYATVYVVFRGATGRSLSQTVTLSLRKVEHRAKRRSRSVRDARAKGKSKGRGARR